MPVQRYIFMFNNLDEAAEKLVGHYCEDSSVQKYFSCNFCMFYKVCVVYINPFQLSVLLKQCRIINITHCNLCFLQSALRPFADKCFAKI